jgi:hypothetical protein
MFNFIQTHKHFLVNNNGFPPIHTYTIQQENVRALYVKTQYSLNSGLIKITLFPLYRAIRDSDPINNQQNHS